MLSPTTPSGQLSVSMRSSCCCMPTPIRRCRWHHFQPERRNYEYVRQGSTNLFVMVEPLAGWRHVQIRPRRTKQDCGPVCSGWPMSAPHLAASLYETFPPAVARRLAQRFEFHHTPKHASWLNMAEIEIALFTLGSHRRIWGLREACSGHAHGGGQRDALGAGLGSGVLVPAVADFLHTPAGQYSWLIKGGVVIEEPIEAADPRQWDQLSLELVPHRNEAGRIIWNLTTHTSESHVLDGGRWDSNSFHERTFTSPDEALQAAGEAMRGFERRQRER
jgi:hypothetical protein